ncbi:MAG: squalene synthase HpnC [Phycisphaera sp.]|nr:squalene synthase HpnC [Phycisphaera sp.]
MASIVLQQLDRYGPDRCDQLSFEQASAYAHDLVRRQYENFSVVSWLVPKRLRNDFAHVYAFCRWADDLGDETGDRNRSLELLAWWRRELAACYKGKPRHPVFVALHPTITRHDIPAKPFEDLIDAFEQDQRVHRYETWEQVIDYCKRSADPVGRLVLYLCGYRDEARQRLSDQTCTALQLINFWQDVRRDIVERDRIYVPADVLTKHGLRHGNLVAHVSGERPLDNEQRQAYREVIRELVDRTEPMFKEGRILWPKLAADVRLSIQLFTFGGESVLKAVRRMNYDTLDTRPSVSKATKAMLMLRVLFEKCFATGDGGQGRRVTQGGDAG